MPSYDYECAECGFKFRVSHSITTKMVDCTSWDQYLQLMEKIYNFKSKQDNRIRLYV